MGAYDFFANTGGFLGLWTGASVMSFIHVVISVVQFCCPRLDPMYNDDEQRDKVRILHLAI